MRRAVLILGLTAGLTAPAAAGDLDQRPVGENPEYVLTGCEAPKAPKQGRIRTVDEYNEAVDRHASYLEAVMAHLGCIQTEAQADYDRLAGAIHTATTAEVTAMQEEIDAAKSELDERRERFLEESGVR
ncbi:hypothetical protein [Euryhalocaulis caribicus]|uniref:hypothetical protein n=1 Tax=Euryhalocaulis caribicus TaxID=1161401 RepID=UPI0003A6F0B4|nr:hypothetical protein [Euryhalocaulis caribicus]